MKKMTKEEYLQEFDLMVKEISDKNDPKYDALVRIAESFLKPYLTRQCSKYSTLRSMELVNDIYHDVILELLKSCVDKFLYRTDTLNYDPEGFLKWIYTVARNVVSDSAKKYGTRQCNEVSIVNENGETIDIPSTSNPLTSVETHETLSECFKAVLQMDCELYILFAWMLRVIVLSKCDLNTVEQGKKDELVETKANEILVSAFENSTMSQIYTVIVLESKLLPWMQISDADNEMILKKLECDKGGVPMGDRLFSSFFMKKGGKATVSDWVYRINSRIVKIIDLDDIGQGG